MRMRVPLLLVVLPNRKMATGNKCKRCWSQKQGWKPYAIWQLLASVQKQVMCNKAVPCHDAKWHIGVAIPKSPKHELNDTTYKDSFKQQHGVWLPNSHGL